MNSKTTTLLFLLSVIAVTIFGYLSLEERTTEDVIQAASLYAFSGHSDEESPAFTHWDDEVPAAIPAFCARCHSPLGFRSYLGEDGSQPGTVEEDQPSGRVITCRACHNNAAHNLDMVTFASGEEFTPVGNEGVCLICHQSRESTDSVEAALGGEEEDAVIPGLNFIDPHYKIAASTQRGTSARSGYEYPDRQYAGYFEHADNAETCVDCHSPHSLIVDPSSCALCHVNVVTSEDFANIRENPPILDREQFDGEGVKGEVEAMLALLYAMIQDYGRNVVERPILFADEIPHFFIDTDGDGQADEDEVRPNNQYDSWTPRLIKAAYNYQFGKQDPGAYVHNSRYILQLLHDSILDLGEEVPLPVDDLERP